LIKGLREGGGGFGLDGPAEKVPSEEGSEVQDTPIFSQAGRKAPRLRGRGKAQKQWLKEPRNNTCYPTLEP
jgi:hypothetical protein